MLNLAAAYSAHAAELRRFAWRNGAFGDADDMVHDAFVSLLETRYRERGQLRAWLFQCVRFDLIDRRRRQARRSFFPLAACDLTTDAPADPCDAPLGRALACLTADQRAVIVARFVEDKSIAETARAMGRSEGAVKSLQHRGLGKMREVLKDGA